MFGWRHAVVFFVLENLGQRSSRITTTALSHSPTSCLGLAGGFVPIFFIGSHVTRVSLDGVHRLIRSRNQGP